MARYAEAAACGRPVAPAYREYDKEQGSWESPGGDKRVLRREWPVRVEEQSRAHMLE